MATLQGKAVKNTYRQVLQIGANNVGVSGTLQPVQDGAGVNTALSLSTLAATVNGDLTITGDLIITGGGIQIKDLIDDTVAALIQNGTGITWTYNDGAATLTGNFTGTTSIVPEGSNLYYTQGRFDSAFAAKSTTNLAEGTNLYFTEARGNANFATNLAASDTDDLDEGVTNLYFSNSRARLALSVTAGTGISYNNTTGVFNLAAIPNASLTNSSITINSQSVALGGSVTLTTTNIAEGTNLYWTNARFDSRFGTKTTTDLAEGTNLYYTQARFNSALAAKTTTDLAEGTNLYYTDARARLALSSSANGLSYANNSGIFSLTAGYAIPTTVKLGEYDIAYNRSIVSAAVTGTSTKTLSLTQQDANVITATWTDQGITTINGTANQIAATTVGNTTTLAFTNDVTMPNNLVVSGNLTINGTATYVNTESISSKDPLFEVANTNNTTDAVDIGYYGRYYDAVQERVEFTGLFRDASDAGKFKIFTGLVDEPTNVVNTTGTGYTVATLVANVDGNLNGTANAANILSTARTIAASGDATYSVSFDGSANVSSALTLANTGVTASTYGTSTSVPTIAVDSKGRITSASNTNITFPVTTVNGFAGTVVLTTSDVAEGTNQYFTTARAQAAITGGASSVVTANLTASRALVSDGSGKIAASATTTTTEIGYLAGVTSAIQTQLNGKLNLTGGTLTGGLIGTTGSFSSSGSGNTFTIAHTSGSGIALNITKDGNGEGLYINKASGSGNAATIIGTLNATTLVKSGGTASQFLKADGSVDSNAYLPLTGGTLTGALSGTSAAFTSLIRTDLGATGTSGIFTGTASNFQINHDGTTAVNLINSGGGGYVYKASNGTTSIFSILNNANVGINMSSPQSPLHIIAGLGANVISIGESGTNTRFTIGQESAYTGNYINSTNIDLKIQAYLSGGSGGNIFFQTGNSGSGSLANRMTITSGGNVGIGTSNPSAAAGLAFVLNSGANQGRICIKTSATGDASGAGLQIGMSGVDAFIEQRENAALSFATNATERIRITSGGYTKISNTGSYNSVGSSFHELRNNSNDNEVVNITHSGSSPYGISLYYVNATPNNGSNWFAYFGDSTLQRFSVRSNGGVYNYQANNLNLSDERTKEDIIPLESYWNKFKAIEIVKFKYKDQTHDDFNIGVIAQQVESVAPEFIDIEGWDIKPKLDEEGNEIISEEEPLKSVYTSDLHHATIKVLQEAMAKIETLEAKIAILEAK